MPFFLPVIPWMETHCLWTPETVRKFYFMCVECHLKRKVQHTQKLLRRRKVAKGSYKVDGALDDREMCKAWKLKLQVEARSGRPWMPKWWSSGIIVRHWGPVEEFLSETILPKPVLLGYDCYLAWLNLASSLFLSPSLGYVLLSDLLSQDGYSSSSPSTFSLILL